MNHGTPFVPLLLITLLAVVVPLLLNRMRSVRLPGVVGEIIAGMIIGQSGLRLVQPSDTLDFLAEFGFTFLMFLSGLEVNFGLLFSPSARSASAESASTIAKAQGSLARFFEGSIWSRPMPLALTIFVMTVALAITAGVLLVNFNLAQNAVLMGLILSTTSLGIVVPVLKERRLTVTRYGQTLLAAALISDFMTLLLLSVSIAVISEGLNLELLLFMVLVVAFVAAAKIGQWATRNRPLTRVMEELSHATSQVRVRGAFALMIAWVVLSESLGVEVILGAFLAGAVISLSSQRTHSSLRDKLDAIGYGFFIPIFFIMVGARFDMQALFSSPSALLLVPLLVAAAYLVKIVPALLFRTSFSWREAFGAGALLSSRLSLIIAASAIAFNLDLISSSTNAAIVLVAIITCTASPILFSRILPAAEEQERKGVIVLGTDQLARLVATRLRNAGEPVTFVSRNSEELEKLSHQGFSVVKGHPAQESVLIQAGAPSARALIAAPTASDLVLEVCRAARERFHIPQIVARVDDAQLAQRLQAIDVRVIQPSLAVALALEGALLYPATYDMLLDQSDNVELLDVHVRNSSIVNTSLRRLTLSGDVLVLGIRRQGEVIVPHGDTVVQMDDVLMLVGAAGDLRETQVMISQEGAHTGKRISNGRKTGKRPGKLMNRSGTGDRG